MKKLDHRTCSLAVKRFLIDPKGVTAIEYGLITGLIAMVIVFTLTSMGSGLANIFNAIWNTLSDA